SLALLPARRDRRVNRAPPGRRRSRPLTVPCVGRVPCVSRCLDREVDLLRRVVDEPEEDLRRLLLEPAEGRPSNLESDRHHLPTSIPRAFARSSAVFVV